MILGLAILVVGFALLCDNARVSDQRDDAREKLARVRKQRDLYRGLAKRRGTVTTVGTLESMLATAGVELYPAQRAHLVELFGPTVSVSECRGEATSETAHTPGGEQSALPLVPAARPPAPDVLDRRLARLLPIWRERYFS